MLSHASTALSRQLLMPMVVSSLGVAALLGWATWVPGPPLSTVGWGWAVAGLVLVVLMWAAGLWARHRALSMVQATLSHLQDLAEGQLKEKTATEALGKDPLVGLMNGSSAAARKLGAQILEMRNRHNEGEISFRIDEQGFPGEYGQMVRDLNAMVAQHIGVKMRAVEVMRHYAAGNLSVDMDRLPGEKAMITDAMDRCKASLMAINGEAQRLASAAAAGDFSVRGDEAAYQHDFLVLIRSLNAMMATSDSNLGKLSALLNALAQGDLRAKMAGDFQGVFARMRDDSHGSMAQLTSIVQRIQDASQSIQTAANEIASGNADLSRRTEQQAVNLEETAASMEELTATVKQNADHAGHANKMAIEAATVAQQGGEVVAQVVDTMGDIQRSSQRIADIIALIDGIAFQTNILSLNAAVEAARAGEQGRGFAVVASEIRTLAQRSAESAKEIKAIVDESTTKVGQGTALAQKAGGTMDKVLLAVRGVTERMAEISQASKEQAQGIEQVNRTIVQMDSATQQNAALVEESSAAAASMASQASGLNQAIAAFKIQGGRPVSADGIVPAHPNWRR